MNYLDGILIIFLAYAAFRGFKNGLIKEVLGIAGLILAVLLGFNLITPASEFITTQWGLDGETVPYLAFGLVFIITLVVVSVISFVLDKIVKLVFLSVPNRIFGCVFSSLKMGIILSIALIFLSGFNFPNRDVRDASLTYPYVLSIAPLAYDAVAKIIPGVSNYKETVERTLEEYNPIHNISF